MLNQSLARSAKLRDRSTSMIARLPDRAALRVVKCSRETNINLSPIGSPTNGSGLSPKRFEPFASTQIHFKGKWHGVPPVSGLGEKQQWVESYRWALEVIVVWQVAAER